ncbi:MAG: SGNH/GDSL hydrolase family protein, partial [Verrucomicrobia bacterium]|nr:SGNH/GDSL hydrolase family protein [Verrucomicrobiota bacterium]
MKQIIALTFVIAQVAILPASIWGAAKTTKAGPHAEFPEPSDALWVRSQALQSPNKGERVVFIGNGLAERDVWYSRLETELHMRFPDQELFVRNMGKPGDTPGFRPHASRGSQWAFPGAEKFHPNHQHHEGIGFFPTPDQWLTHLKAETVVAFFGYNESFDGEAGLSNFEAELTAWVKHTFTKAYNGQYAPRVVLVSPIAFEDLSDHRHLPDGKKENENLASYTAAMKRVASQYGLTFVDLFSRTKRLYQKQDEPFT